MTRARILQEVRQMRFEELFALRQERKLPSRATSICAYISNPVYLARHDAGYQLDKVQRGEQPDDFKPMPSIDPAPHNSRPPGPDPVSFRIA